MAAARSLWHVMNSLIFHVVLLAYLLASLTFWFHLGLRRRWIYQLAGGLLAGGFVLQTALLGYRLWTQTFLAWDDVYAYLGLLSWAIVAAYLITVWRYPIDALGAFIVPLAFLAAAVSGVPEITPTTLPAAFRNLWLGIHIFVALLGYAALTLMFCAGVMYLMQENQLKSKRPGALYHRLPSLSLLDDLNGRALILGFPLLTQGIITGSVWAKYLHGSYLHWSLTSLPLLLAWMMYALLLAGRFAMGWRGKKAAFAAVGGFVVVLVSYFVHAL